MAAIAAELFGVDRLFADKKAAAAPEIARRSAGIGMVLVLPS
jgi:hypothetical protein